MKTLASLFLTLPLVAPVMADTEEARTRVELGLESSHLDNGSPNWREQSLQITRQRGSRDVKALTLTQTQRFGLDDNQISALYATPLSDKLTATLGASISPTHRVLPRHGVEGALQYEFAPAWLVQGGLSNNRYNNANVNQGSLGLEHYFSSFSLGASWRPVRALGTSAHSTELRGSYYYGDANFVGFIASSGREATSVSGIGLNSPDVVLADVRATALLGRHWLSPKWALNYAFSSTRQGSFYHRNSVRVGAEYVF